MPDTQWENIIDKMVDENTRVLFHVISNEGQPTLAGSTLVRNHDYYMNFRVQNIGTEVLFWRLQARLVAKPNIQLFTDYTYSTPTGRIHIDWYGVNPSQWVSENIYFRVTQDISNADIVGYGLYAVVLPEGHVWNDLNWPGDLNRPQ